MTKPIKRIETHRDNARTERDKADLWEMVADAVSEQGDPFRDRMVCRVGKDTYVASHRWEINPTNGFLTIQTADGDVLPTRLGHWCPGSYACDFFEIERSDIENGDKTTE